MDKLLLVTLALIPPAAFGLKKGVGGPFLLNIRLVIPGTIHARWLCERIALWRSEPDHLVRPRGSKQIRDAMNEYAEQVIGKAGLAAAGAHG